MTIFVILQNKLHYLLNQFWETLKCTKQWKWLKEDLHDEFLNNATTNTHHHACIPRRDRQNCTNVHPQLAGMQQQIIFLTSWPGELRTAIKSGLNLSICINKTNSDKLFIYYNFFLFFSPFKPSLNFHKYFKIKISPIGPAVHEFLARLTNSNSF